MNTLKDSLYRRPGPPVVSKDSKGLFRPDHLSRKDFAAETAGATKMLRLGEIPFTASHVLFCFFVLVDIRHQVVPTDNATFGIMLRTTSYVEPTVHTIG